MNLSNEEESLGRSLMERLMELPGFEGAAQGVYDAALGLLNVQYRMHPAISQWPCTYYYQGHVHDGPGVEDARCPVLGFAGSSGGKPNLLRIQVASPRAGGQMRFPRAAFGDALCCAQ